VSAAAARSASHPELPFIGDPFVALHSESHAIVRDMLAPQERAALIAAYDDDERYRKRVDMAAHNFGRGEYRYFADPLPELVAALRTELYARLAGVANAWNERLRQPARFPASLAEFAEISRAAGQARPTPLILKYGPGDHNRLHQDRYGDVIFPLQVTLLLSEPGRDFEGGEFALVEQHPRAQSTLQVVPLRAGDAVAFAVDRRPQRTQRGGYAVRTRHGVSTVRSGSRYALGLIFHDAR
jgi:hypothetical protein